MHRFQIPRAAAWLAVAAGLGWLAASLRPALGPTALPGPARLEPPLAQAPAREGPRYPVPQAPVRPLPPLDGGDAQIRDALAGLVGSDGIRGLLAPAGLVRGFVATVDGLDGRSLRGRASPLRSPAGALEVEEGATRPRLSAQNAERYESYVRALEEVPARKMVALYSRLYPLAQKAYEERRPGAYFNDRLVEVIDHLLAAPDFGGPVELVRTATGYAFADPALESLSAGHKLLLRLGPRSAWRVKARLREVRRLLALQGPPPGRSEALAE